MGLLLSVLVFSVGVIEALSCYSRFRSGYLPLSYQKGRRHSQKITDLLLGLESNSSRDYPDGASSQEDDSTTVCVTRSDQSDVCPDPSSDGDFLSTEAGSECDDDSESVASEDTVIPSDSFESGNYALGNTCESEARPENIESSDKDVPQNVEAEGEFSPVHDTWSDSNILSSLDPNILHTKRITADRRITRESASKTDDTLEGSINLAENVHVQRNQSKLRRSVSEPLIEDRVVTGRLQLYGSSFSMDDAMDGDGSAGKQDKRTSKKKVRFNLDTVQICFDKDSASEDSSSATDIIVSSRLPLKLPSRKGQALMNESFINAENGTSDLSTESGVEDHENKDSTDRLSDDVIATNRATTPEKLELLQKVNGSSIPLSTEEKFDETELSENTELLDVELSLFNKVKSIERPYEKRKQSKETNSETCPPDTCDLNSEGLITGSLEDRENDSSTIGNQKLVNEVNQQAGSDSLKGVVRLAKPDKESEAVTNSGEVNSTEENIQTLVSSDVNGISDEPFAQSQVEEESEQKIHSPVPAVTSGSERAAIGSLNVSEVAENETNANTSSSLVVSDMKKMHSTAKNVGEDNEIIRSGSLLVTRESRSDVPSKGPFEDVASTRSESNNVSDLNADSSNTFVDKNEVSEEDKTKENVEATTDRVKPSSIFLEKPEGDGAAVDPSMAQTDTSVDRKDAEKPDKKNHAPKQKKFSKSKSNSLAGSKDVSTEGGEDTPEVQTKDNEEGARKAPTRRGAVKSKLVFDRSGAKDQKQVKTPPRGAGRSRRKELKEASGTESEEDWHVEEVSDGVETESDGEAALAKSSTSEERRRRNNLDDNNKADKAFWLIFSGEYTKAMSKDWHSSHFCCWQCDESLTGQRYVLRDDHPYCIKCYESVFANSCEECSRVIGIDSKDLSYKDKHWHEACFLCSKCRVSLVDKQFGSKADKIYCGNCYDAQFASRCDGCGQIFRAGTKKMEYKTRQWHEQCFCCCVCKTPIGTKSFIPREQEIYCATCYEEKFATRCVKCNKIITSGGVTYKNEPWHRECFTCTNCGTSLAGQRFTSREDKPYCADCFGELFAKRCTACCKPITGIGGTRFISFEDRHWHNDCFICASCKTSLVGRGFITDGEDIICPECAKQKLM